MTLKSHVIFDNSTITAIQRLNGQITVPRSYNVEGDFSALENFLSNLLFYDNFFYIDDYKEEFKTERKEAFPYIRKIDPKKIPYVEAQKYASDTCADLGLKIEAGKIEGNSLTNFLEDMDLYLTSSWIMASSAYFLTLQILSGEHDDKYKYSPLTAAIFQQLRDDGEIIEGKNPVLISNKGRNIPLEGFKDGRREYHITPQLVNLSNSLNWLSHRSALYSAIGTYYGASVSLHPIRHHFVNSFAKKTSFYRQSKFWKENFREYFAESASGLSTKINANVIAPEHSLDLPILSHWALQKTSTIGQAIDYVLDVRTSKSGVKVRQRLNELESIDDNKKFAKEINKLRSAIAAELENITRKSGIDTFQRTTAISVSASVPAGLGVSINKDYSIPKLGLSYQKSAPFRSLFRSIVNDVSSFPTLGSTRGRVLRNLKRFKEGEAEAGINHHIRHEPRKFANSYPDWKQRM